MPEKRMLIVPAELVRMIDENRGDMTQADFIEFLLNGQLTEKVKEPTEEKKYATKEQFHIFEEDIKQLLKNFLDFFVSYGLELGKQSPQAEVDNLSAKLQELESGLAGGGKKGEAKIKWK